MDILRNIARSLIPRRWTRYARAKREIVFFSGGKVYQGPFAGMIYLTAKSDWVDCAMLLGVYERELSAIVRAVLSGGYKRFIEVGSAQGFYAVGVALKGPKDIKVIAFESNELAREEAARKAAVNGLAADKISWRGYCDTQTLGRLDLTAHDLLWIDIDGGERFLLSAESVPHLMSCDILVETHDFMDAGITDLLRGRFSPTHDIEELIWSPVKSEELPLPHATPIHALCVNGRPAQRWLMMRSRQNVRS
jgi:hypothetical protein